jgi:iron complex outermembrane receptor protein
MAAYRKSARAVLAAMGITAPMTLVAQQVPEQALPEVKVQGPRLQASPYGPDKGYRAERSTAATKTDTPLHETPQAISIVTRERIEDQGAQSLQDALNYAAGVRSNAYGLDSRSDNIRVRGAYPDEYRDGLRKFVGFYTSSTRTEPYTLERIEVLRGPAAMLYGQGSTAGIVNMVSKRPLAEPYREVGVQLGNHNRKQLQADLTGPLTQDGTWLYRLVALGRDSDTQVDHVADDRKLIAPSLTWRPSAATSLTLQGLWQDDHSGSTSQFFPFSGVVLPNPNGRIPTNRFVGAPGVDRFDTKRLEGGWLFEHHLNERWTVRQNLRYARNEVDYFTLFSDSFSNPTAPFIDPAQRVLNRIGFFENRKNNVLSADQHLEGRFASGPLRHHLLVGLDLLRFRERSDGASDAPPPIDVFDPVYLPYTPPPLTPNPGSKLRQTGVYIQDQIRIAERWIVVAGLRHDRATSTLAGASDERDRATTKRGALMYLFDGGFAPYVSYSESFTPVAGTNAEGQRFVPMRGEQIEVGVKWESPRKDLTATLALYELDENKRLVLDPTNAINQIQVGKTRTRGAEVELVGRVIPGLDIAAHYNYTDIDETLEALPPHQAAIWGTHRFAIGDTPGFMAGLGVRYMSAFTDGAAPRTPAVTLLDGLLGYDQGPWRYTVHVQNLTDKTYVSTCLSRGDCWYGQRRTVIASARYRF